MVSSATAELVRTQLAEGVRLLETERDGTGAVVYELLAPGQEPQAVPDDEPCDVQLDAPPADTPPADTPPVDVPSVDVLPVDAPAHLVEQRSDVERAAKNALVLADEHRRAGNTEAAARLERTALDLADRLAAIERELGM